MIPSHPHKLNSSLQSLTISKNNQTTSNEKDALMKVVSSPQKPAKRINEKTKMKLSKMVVQPDGTIKPFSQIKVSTCTVIVFTNCTIDLPKLFQFCPITDFEPQIKKRGRRKRNSFEKPPPKLPIGSVIKIQHELKVRGKDKCEKEKKPMNEMNAEEAFEEEEKRNKRDFFLHCVVMVVVVDHEKETGKQITKNVKIYSNGKLQITGCKNSAQYINTVKAVFDVFHSIHQYTGLRVATSSESTYKAVFNVVMQNMDFFMGFNIFRSKLDQFINSNTNYKSIFEGSMNTCVNIKIPIDEKDETFVAIEYNANDQSMKEFQVNQNDFKGLLSKKNKSDDEPAEHTFLVFASGHVIFTSTPGPSMEKIFYKIIDLLMKNRYKFEEEKKSIV